MSNDDTKSDLAAADGGGPLNLEMKQEGIKIRRFRLYAAMEKDLFTVSQFKYRANSVMVDRVGLAELAEQKRIKKLPRIAEEKARNMFFHLKLTTENMLSDASPDYDIEQMKQISENISNGLLTEKNLRDALLRQYQYPEPLSNDAGYSLKFLLAFPDEFDL